MSELTCFKAYDIRGKLGEELNEDVAYRIGRAFARQLDAKNVVVGGDIRLTSPSLKNALAEGLMQEGVNVTDIGLCGTEEIYFATTHLNMDGGIVVTASHNPKDYNGMKLVRENSKPISGDTGLFDIKRMAEENQFDEQPAKPRGTKTEISNLAPYVDHLLGYIDVANIKPMKIVVNAGNGAAGHVIDEIERRFDKTGVPIEFIKIHHEPDGNFPNGIPNPLLPENRASTRDAVIAHNADLGIAWDGDFDRCFLFDETGEFIEGYYIVGLLAEAFLKKNPGAKIIHDPRLTWNTIDIVEANGGQAIQSKTGHAFIKERMRAEDAIYGGEMSAHHYFKDFFYCDSGMIPWLLVAELLCLNNKKMSEVVSERIAKFPSSGEINRRVENAKAAIAKVREAYIGEAKKVETVDGLSMEFDNWRFNLRMSNTEPLLRLNVESFKGNKLMQLKQEHILSIIQRIDRF